MNKWYRGKVVKKVNREIENRLQLVGEFLSAVSRLLAPVLTGFLSGEIFYKVYSPTTLRIGNNAYYAIYVEFGTGVYASNGQGRKGGWFYKDEKGIGHFTYGQKPQPSLTPLLEGYEEDILAILTSKK